MPKNKLSISIVNYNAGDYLLRCLESIQKIKDEANIKIYIVDNASNDDSITKAKKRFPNLNYILNKDNIGFGRAHNIALRRIQTEYILILNPDTEIEPGSIKYMLDYMDKNPDVGVSTCKVVFGNGKIDLTAHRGFPTPWASFKYYFLKDDSLYHLSRQDLDTTHEVDALSGSFLLTRKSVLDKVGLFDEDYFMYAEDIDLCWRIKQAGFKVMYVPQVKIVHYKGVSSGLKKHTQTITTATKETRIRSTNAFYEAMLIFYKKQMSSKYPFFINWLVYAGIHAKWFLAKRKLTV